MPTSPDEVHYYGNSPYQVINCYTAPSAGSPAVLMAPAAGFGSGVGNQNSLNTQANQLRNQGCAVFVCNYRGDSAPPSPVPAFPMEVDDYTAAALWMQKHSGAFNGSTDGKIHLMGGSAAGTLAALTHARLTEMGIPVASVQMISSNTDWWTAIAWYRSLLGGPNNSIGVNHLGNISNAYGYDTSTMLALIDAGTLTAASFADWSPAQRCTRKAADTWWQVFQGATDLEIPLQQPYIMHQALVDVGCNDTLTIIDASAHGYNLWSAVYPAIARFARAAA